MIEFPSFVIEVDGEFDIDVNGDTSAGGHVYRIEALRLAFQQPFGDFLATAGDGSSEDIIADITGHVVYRRAVFTDDGRSLGRGRRIGSRLDRHHPDTLGEECRRIGFAFTTDAGNTLTIRYPAQCPIAAAGLATTVVAGNRFDGAVIEYEGDRIEPTGHAG